MIPRRICMFVVKADHLDDNHAEVIGLRGDSYQLRDRDLGRVPAATTEEN